MGGVRAKGGSEVSFPVNRERLQLRGRVWGVFIVPHGTFPCPYCVGGLLVSGFLGAGLLRVEQELGVLVYKKDTEVPVDIWDVHWEAYCCGSGWFAELGDPL